MKRLWMVTLALAAGCGLAPADPEIPGAPAAAVPQPPATAIATFQGVVDVDRQTMSIEVLPLSGEGSKTALVIADGAGQPVALSTVLPTWFNVDGAAHGCAAGTMVWGGDVKLTLQNTAAGAPSYAGLHAVITSMTSGATSLPCAPTATPAALPAGFTTSYGAFAYGTLDPAGTTSATVPWAFVYSGSGLIKFAGVIVGAEVSTKSNWFATSGTALVGATSSRKIAYPEASSFMAVVDGATGTPSYSPSALKGSVYALATDGAHVWAGAQETGVGQWLQITDMSGATSGQVQVSDMTYTFADIAIDPLVANRAWFTLEGSPTVLGTLNSATGAATPTLGTPVTLADYRPAGLAYGPDNRLWVTLPAYVNPSIQACPLAGVCANPVSVAGVPDCAWPTAIMKGPSGTKLWFISDRSLDPHVVSTVGAVCTIDTANNAVAKVLNVTAPQAIAVGPDGNVWVASKGATEGVLTRILATGTEGRPLTFSIGRDLLQVASDGVDLYVAGNDLAYRTTVSKVRYLPWQ